MNSIPLEPNCTIWARPNPKSNEGISDWISHVVVKYFLQAKLLGCNLFIDYGPDVDIHQVLAPVSDELSGSASPAMNWTVPSDFDCSQSTRWRMCMQDGFPVAPSQFPRYRFAHWRDPIFWLNRTAFKDLEEGVPGFRLESGMACSLGSLFRLSPRASQFEPQLFTKILPTLQNEQSLVFSVYIRTGLTDEVARRENTTTHNEQGRDPYSKPFQSHRAVKCVLSLEQQQLVQQPAYARVIWMVVTDSSNVKHWIVDNYSGQDIYLNDSSAEERMSPQVVKREILTTTSRGVHTRTLRSPSTVDFAEAMIDWFLIGESDVVIGDGLSSFGATGALRTARPYYDMSTCSLVEMVH